MPAVKKPNNGFHYIDRIDIDSRILRLERESMRTTEYEASKNFRKIRLLRSLLLCRGQENKRQSSLQVRISDGIFKVTFG